MATVEQIYQKKSLYEHIFTRPDSYIGSVQYEKVDMWIFEKNNEKFNKKEIDYNPGLYKIFDEILVNAADNKYNSAEMNMLKVTLNLQKGTITVWNNGKGIPIVIHKDEKMYIPEMLFGNLLASSNYNDEIVRKTGGRNGYGAKLANIFSNMFIYEGVDSENKKKYIQVWKNNMKDREDPKITSFSGKSDYVSITFAPDFKYFKTKSIQELFSDDFVALIRRRTCDIAGLYPGLKVTFTIENEDGKSLEFKFKSFKEYCEMYTDNIVAAQESADSEWSVCVAPSPNQKFDQISFINSVATTDGGTHVNYVVDQLVTAFKDALKPKKGETTMVQSASIKNQLWVFVSARLDKPDFDAQMKNQLKTPVKKFSSKFEPSDLFLKKLKNSDILVRVNELNLSAEEKQIKKSDGSKSSRINVPKLEDANFAGTKQSAKCTLFLTEGDSAKALVMSGMGVIGRDYFGVYPLRGKMLNVRKASTKSILDNEEISNIKKILGLQHGKTGISHLRYGRVIPMTDQDYDGQHIKGLIINLFAVLHVDLLSICGFISIFSTPIMIVKKNKEEKYFYRLEDANDFLRVNRGWDQKYLKGLGSSTSQEAKSYFKYFYERLRPFEPATKDELDLLDMAFTKENVDKRKEWLNEFGANPVPFDENKKSESITEFTNQEFILYSMEDNIRMIPSMMDGLKPSQRKVVFGVIKKKLNKSEKVSQLAGYITEQAHYLHGEVSLTDTIIRMAQNYVGSNNVELLFPDGNFGTRLMGGKDTSSSRYVSTRMNEFISLLFKPEDNELLIYNDEDGKPIEPKFYVPVLPLLVINGCEGIGYGWRSSIAQHNPLDVANYILALMDGRETPTLKPWFRGFKGTLLDEGNGKWKSTGIWSRIDDTTIKITELPIGMWTSDYEEEIIKKLNIEYKTECSDTIVSFTITLRDTNEATLKEVIDPLTAGNIPNSNNIVAFNMKHELKRYKSIDELMIEFYNERLPYYEKRKINLLKSMREEEAEINNRRRFVELVLSGKIQLIGVKKADLSAALTREKLTDEAKLLALRADTFTQEMVASLREKSNTITKMRNDLELKSPKELWKSDINEFVVAYKKSLIEYDEQANENISIASSSSVAVKKPRVKK